MRTAPKFRGKSIDEDNKGQWVYGNLIVDGKQAFIVNGVIECNEQYISLEDWRPVDPKTVGQWTGLLDKNDKEIYEGDIVHAYDLDRDEGKIFKTADLVGVAEYHGNAFCLKSGTGIYNTFWLSADEYEVSGNVHDSINWDSLLEGKHEPEF